MSATCETRFSKYQLRSGSSCSTPVHEEDASLVLVRSFGRERLQADQPLDSLHLLAVVHRFGCRQVELDEG